MNILTPSQAGSMPGYLFHQPPCVKTFPHVVEIGDAWGKIGSGIGDESSAEQSALGEYFERRHFYMEVASELRATLRSALGSKEAHVFCDAFLQTSQRLLTPVVIDEHAFDMTKAYRISDFSACFIPTALLSLTHIKGDPDNEIYPGRDTCGCSFHLSSELSIFGAIKESLERQFLARFWLTKKCNYKLTSEMLKKQFQNQPRQALLNLLCKAGEVMALDVSDQRFPGKCVVLIYGSKDTSRNVRYCAGMAYANSLKNALEKALLELWQTFRFMQLIGELKNNAADVEDPYLRHFLSCNTFSTFENMAAAIESSEPAKSTALDKPDMSANGLVQALRKQNIEGYLYIKAIQHSGNQYTFCKFVSPSLFLHMNNAKNINMKNKYSDGFATDISPIRKTVMVPFP